MITNKSKRRITRKARSVAEKQGPIVIERVSFKELLSQMPDGGDDSDFERNDDLGREIDL